MTQEERSDNTQVTKDSFECSITTDIIIFGYLEGKLKVLLTKRKVGYLKESWLLPGGVMKEGQKLEDCARKVLSILTGLDNIHFEQVKVYGDLNRHPIKRVITISFYALVNPKNHPLRLKNNVLGMEWFDIGDLPKEMGFDHLELIHDAHEFLKKNLNDQLLIKELLPNEFTLPELQLVFERILNLKFDKRNFRKRIHSKNILINTDEKKIGVKGGPFLYRLRNE